MTHSLALLAPFWADRLLPAGRDWLERALHAQDFDRNRFLLDFGSAARKLDRTPLQPGPGEIEAAHAAHIDWLIVGSTVVEIARVALLVSAAARAPDGEIVPLVLECYRQGDNGEKRAVLRSLFLLPDPARFV